MATNTTSTTCEPVTTGCTPTAPTVTTVASSSCAQSTACAEVACQPVDWVTQSKSLLVTNYNNCHRQLQNKAFAVPFQSVEGCIDWRDGSAGAPITLSQLQTRTGSFNYLPALDANKNLVAIEPNRALSGDQTLKYVESADAFMFVADSEDCLGGCLSGSSSSSDSPSTCYDLNSIASLSGSESTDGAVVLTQTTDGGTVKHCLRSVSEHEFLGACKPIKNFTTIADSDKTYNAVWKVSNAGIGDCECLTLNYEEVSDIQYRKYILDSAVCVPVDLSEPAVNGLTAAIQLFDFTTLGTGQPDWANRVIVRVSITPGSVDFDSTGNISATALVADANNNLASVTLRNTAGTDSSFSGEVSLPINATGFSVIAGSGIINDSAVLASNAVDIFSAQICVVGFELVETTITA